MRDATAAEEAMTLQFRVRSFSYKDKATTTHLIIAPGVAKNTFMIALRFRNVNIWVEEQLLACSTEALYEM